MRGVAVTTGTRLHFGPICWGEGLPRRFGGLGLMLDQPTTQRLRAIPADEWSTEGPQADRVLGWARLAAGWFGDRGKRCPPLRITVDRAAPAHVGLGSGTQLALATARLVAHFAGGADPSAAELAGATGRGARSAVGLHGFERGGLIVEGGHPPGDEAGGIPPLLARVELPASWRVLLSLPDSAPGLHGKPESEAFRRLPPFPTAMVDRLCSLVLLGILPAVAEDDLEAFGAALEEIQALVGDAFAPAQGGRYAGPGVEAMVDLFRREGMKGVGQSSWGPAVYGFARRDPDAEAAMIDRHPDLFTSGQLFWALPARAGARLESSSEPWRNPGDGPSPAMA